MNIFKSRQLVTAIVDAVVGIVALLLPRFLPAADVDFFAKAWILCQPVVAALILQFTTDDQTKRVQAMTDEAARTLRRELAPKGK